MFVGPNKVAYSFFHKICWQSIYWYHTAPGNIAGKYWILFAQQLITNNRLNAICCYETVTFKLTAIGTVHGHFIRFFCVANHGGI